MTSIPFDKRLYQRYLKSNEVTREQLQADLDQLPDLSAEVRYRQLDEPEVEEPTASLDEVSQASSQDSNPSASELGDDSP